MHSALNFEVPVLARVDHSGRPNDVSTRWRTNP